MIQTIMNLNCIGIELYHISVPISDRLFLDGVEPIRDTDCLPERTDSVSAEGIRPKVEKIGSARAESAYRLDRLVQRGI